jgi:hypothetical protein
MDAESSPNFCSAIWSLSVFSRLDHAVSLFRAILLPIFVASGSGVGNTVVFKGFESLYKQVVDIEDQLLCSEV